MVSKPGDNGALGLQILEWDSSFFGRRIARIEASGFATDGGAAAIEWCRRERVECAYLLVDADDQGSCDAALAQSFRLVDLRVTLSKLNSMVPEAVLGSPPVKVRAAVLADVDSLKVIARVSHRDTRFYVDGKFDRGRCDELYAVWIEKSCAGGAEQVYVAEVSGVAAGYITCHQDAGTGPIGLIAVAGAFQHRGLGCALGLTACRYFVSLGTERVSVVTSGRNAAALAFYQKLGFSVSSIQLSFHNWF